MSTPMDPVQIILTIAACIGGLLHCSQAGEEVR
jgi:hypothetical protein